MWWFLLNGRDKERLENWHLTLKFNYLSYIKAHIISRPAGKNVKIVEYGPLFQIEVPISLKERCPFKMQTVARFILCYLFKCLFALAGSIQYHAANRFISNSRVDIRNPQLVRKAPRSPITRVHGLCHCFIICLFLLFLHMCCSTFLLIPIFWSRLPHADSLDDHCQRRHDQCTLFEGSVQGKRLLWKGLLVHCKLFPF